MAGLANAHRRLWGTENNKQSGSGGGDQKAGTQGGGTCPLNQLMTNGCSYPANTEARAENAPGGVTGIRCVAPGTPAQQQQPAEKKCINNLVKWPNGVCGCPANLPILLGNKCVKELPNLLQQPKPPSQQQQRQQQQNAITPADPNDCGDGRRKDNPTGRCLCPGNLTFINGSCVPVTTGKVQNGRSCVPRASRSCPAAGIKVGPACACRTRRLSSNSSCSISRSSRS
ncbi:MAG TPA: hypothetical protein VMW57_11240 [Methyloceanibacter sp.]|nr:hypothetical protein [Methyloceanibacter sp.]